MKITDIISSGHPSVSFEVFPPKKGANADRILDAVSKISVLKPSFMSVTYGAGGSTGTNTADVASFVQNKCGVTALAHLTCLTATRSGILSELERLKELGIENILALRGDIPADSDVKACGDFAHASDLASEIMRRGDFCVGGACYPEGHTECEHLDDDITNLKKKIDAGVGFLTTQMFFDNNIFYRYLFKLRERGITVPVIAGIMPVSNGKQISRVCALSGTYLPSRFKAIVDRFGGDPVTMAEAGIAYATEQIVDLFANGINAVHVYTMNKPEIAAGIMHNLSGIIERG